MEIDRQQILMSVLETIDNISDKEYQQRIWIQNKGPECQAFDDAVCDFFDLGDPLLDAYKDFGITENQYHLLKKLRDNFDAFADENNYPEEFIDTEEWAKIIEMAKEVLKAFHYQKKS